mgnify:CR=1 FL=1
MPYYFKIPALATPPLTIDQRAAIYQTLPVSLSGGPGTGKSVVSLYRHITNVENGKSSQLITFTKTLALYLAQTCKEKNQLASENICTIDSWLWKLHKRDELIVDEAQDIKYRLKDKYGRITWKSRDENGKLYEKINIYESVLKQRYPKVSFGADNAQMLTEDGIRTEELKQIFPNNISISLRKNFRNTKPIMELSQNMFDNANISDDDIENCVNDGELPYLFIGGEDEQEERILTIIDRFYSEDAHNIAILCPTAEMVNQYFEFISEKFDDTSFYITANNGIDEIKKIHVTTFISAKGLEFDTVILPQFEKATYEYSKWKQFFVGVTRAKNNLYLLSGTDIPKIHNFVEVLSVENNTDNQKDDFRREEIDDLPF